MSITIDTSINMSLPTTIAILDSNQSIAFNVNSRAYNEHQRNGRLVQAYLPVHGPLSDLKRAIRGTCDLLNYHAFELMTKDSNGSQLEAYTDLESRIVELSRFRGSHSGRMYVRFQHHTCPRYCGCELAASSPVLVSSSASSESGELGPMGLDPEGQDEADEWSPRGHAPPVRTPPRRPPPQRVYQRNNAFIHGRTGDGLRFANNHLNSPTGNRQHGPFGPPVTGNLGNITFSPFDDLDSLGLMNSIVEGFMTTLMIDDINDVVTQVLEFFDDAEDKKRFRVKYRTLAGQDAGGITRDLFNRFFDQLPSFKLSGSFVLLDEHGVINFDQEIPIEKYWMFNALGHALTYAIEKKIKLPNTLNSTWFKGLIILWKSSFFATLSIKTIDKMSPEDKAFFIHELTPTTNMMLYQWINQVLTQGTVPKELLDTYIDCKDLGPYVLSLLEKGDTNDILSLCTYWVVYDNYFGKMQLLYPFVLAVFGGSCATKESFKHPIASVIEDNYPALEDIIEELFVADFIDKDKIVGCVRVLASFDCATKIEKITRIKNWMAKFIKETTQEELKKFLVFVTGSSQQPRVLLIDLKRTLQERLPEPYNRLPIAHTCSFTLEVYAGYMTNQYEKFKEDILAAMNSGDYGFQIQ